MYPSANPHPEVDFRLTRFIRHVTAIERAIFLRACNLVSIFWHVLMLFHFLFLLLFAINHKVHVHYV